MKLPNGDKATVDERRVHEYLLSTSHPIGRFTEKLFAGPGFAAANWQDLAKAMAQLAENGDAELVQTSEVGRKYLVMGTLTGFRGRAADVVSVGILRAGSDTPRLVTVYPG